MHQQQQMHMSEPDNSSSDQSQRPKQTAENDLPSTQNNPEEHTEDNNNKQSNKSSHQHQISTNDEKGRHHKNHQNNQQQQPKLLKQKPFIDPNLLLTASDYKLAGNKLCSLFRYEEAITYYSKAITKSPDVAIFYSNRALCHIKLQQWSNAIQDCRRALDLEANSIKAHFFLGQALAELNNHDDALKHLQRAHELAKEEKLNFGDDIAYQIRLVRRRKWSKLEDDTAQLEDELQSYLVNLINKDREEKLRLTRGRLDDSGVQTSADTPWQPIPSSSTGAASVAYQSEEVPSENSSKNQETIIQERCDNYIDKLESMFNDLKLKRKKRDVPDYLCGKISFEIMHDPVITPSGITYDRRDIEEHLKRVGHFDPITRQPLKANQLISNLAMKEVVDAYLNENEWALYY